jgi:AAA15 family ATPase/GTPase
MWISEIELKNFRSFPDAKIQLSEGINLIIGSNNSGKSSLLRSVIFFSSLNMILNDITQHNFNQK